MKDLMLLTGLVVMVTALTGMLAGAVMSVVGTVARRTRVGVLGARLALGGPGLASLGAGIWVAALPWPVTPLAVMPVTFGALGLWFALHTRITFIGRR